MKLINKEILVKAIKRSRSPKMALDGLNFLLKNEDLYRQIFQLSFEIVWRDATKRNRAIERSEGVRSKELWPNRLNVEDDVIKADANKILSLKKRPLIKEIGRILSDYDENGILKVFEIIKASKGQASRIPQ